ncbi:MAG: hypothetical protein R2699_06840 [Acidimicrobiales bacterium]
MTPCWYCPGGSDSLALGDLLLDLGRYRADGLYMASASASTGRGPGVRPLPRRDATLGGG